MYQLFEETEVSFNDIKRLSIGKDSDTNLSNFIFIEAIDGWYQIYLDVQVLFIQNIGNIGNIIDYLEDLDQAIVIDIKAWNLESLKIKYQLNSSRLLFESRSINLAVSIIDDNFSLIKVEYILN